MTAPDERLDGPEAESFLMGACALAREVAVTPTWFEMAVRSLEAAYTERPLIPAPTLAIDLAALMHGERLLPLVPPAVEVLRDALRVYEDHVLARLTADRRWTRLSEALIGAPKELHAAAIGMTVSQVLQRLGVATGTGVSTGLVRRLATKPIEEVLDAGRAALWDAALAQRLAEGLHTVARAARRTRELLSDAEVFLIENIAALKGLGPRVALAQLAEVAQAVDERLPTRLRGNVFEDGDAPTQIEEDSAYPVGGFSSISNQGSLENLMTSELIYMEQGSDPASRPDLFDVRFVESELLYYSRDESVAVRRKRTLVLVFDPSLIRARVLDAGESYQRLVWAMGSVTALVRKLSEWLDNEALRFELVFVSQNGESPLEEERNIAQLLLREFKERGQLEFVEATSTLDAIRHARETHLQRARVMLFATQMPSGLEGLAQPDALVDANGPRPVVHWVEAITGTPEAPKTAVESWAATTRELLDGLMKKKRIRTAA